MYLPYIKVIFKLKILRVPDLVSTFPLSILYQKGLREHMCGYAAFIQSSAHTRHLKQHPLAILWS